jgi:S1-C subfamily serine protease
VSSIAKTLTPAVVDIQTTINSSSGTGQAAGTGMIVTSSGEVLTNNHVVEGATTISVTISGRAQAVSATVVGVDPVHDVAVLQLQGVSNLPYVSLGNSSSAKLGTSVVAIGNALGLGGAPTVTSGTITAVDRTISATDAATSGSESLTGLLETDAQIQPGDSGGPLVNSSGQVVGMDTAAASTDGGPSVGFAIPINKARTIAQNIVAGNATNGIILGLSAFLGVDVQAANAPSSTGFGLGLGNPGTSTPSTSTGQFVVAVVTGGPAAKAGIVAGDTITSLNGTAITNDGSTLTKALAALKPGASASVGVVNQAGTSQTITVVVGAIPK